MKKDLIVRTPSLSDLDESSLAGVVGGGPQPDPWIGPYAHYDPNPQPWLVSYVHFADLSALGVRFSDVAL